MADNAAQAIKDLQKNIANLDGGLKQAITDFGSYEKMISSVFHRAAEEGKMEINDLLSYLAKKTHKVSEVEKIRLQIQFADEGKTKEGLEQAIKNVNNAIEKNKEVTIFGEEIKGAELLKEKLKELKGVLDDYKKVIPETDITAAMRFQQTLNLVNNAAGVNKKSFSPLTKQRAKDEKEIQKIQEVVTQLLQKRKELEEQIAKYSPDSKSKKLRELKEQWEGVNKEVQNYLAKIASHGTAGSRALATYEKMGLIGKADKEQMAAERNYINLLRERQQLEEKSLRLRLQLQNAQTAGKASPEFITRSESQLVDNAGKIKVLEKKLIDEKVELTKEGQRRVEEMELAHQNNLTNITNQGEMARQRIIQKAEAEAAKESDDEAKKQLAMWEAEVKNRQDLAKQKKQAEAEAAKAAKQEKAETSRIEKAAISNMRDQERIKKRLAELDHNRTLNQGQRSRTEKEEYAALNRELTTLIKQQKEYNAARRGVTGKARTATESQHWNYQTKEAERYRRELEKIDKQNKQVNDSTSRMIPTLQRLASAFGIAFSIRGLAQFGKKLIEVRGEFELQQVALRSILQNKQLADEIWDKTLRASLQSPFTAMQLTTYTKQLAAYRIETAKLFDTTKRLADVSAGLGVDMQRLILAYGQVKAANYLRASEIRQFTEAGVNILGELSQYFTEVKGEMVSTSQVMDMVQKRMVRFEDVAEIFKRMTDQGGIFYNMQYIQSQTVRGQMMKLKDAFDQMLNSIGQGNEGVIKNLISLLNDIVKNWREWKTAIDLIAWPVIISMLHKFALGLIAVDAAAIKASVGMNTMVVAGARLQLLFKRLWAAIAAHPLFALASALAAVGVALWNHAKAVDGINKAYEDLMLRTYETQKNLSEYSKTIQRNSEIMAHATKDTDEYNKAYSENEKIISKLSNDYPDLLKDVDLQKEGYGVLIDKIETYNKKLEDRIRLEYAARASFGTGDLATNIADMQEALRKREMEFLENREKAEKRYLELKAQGKESEEGYWNKMMRLAKNWAEQVDVLEQNKTAMRDGGISLLSQGFVMPGIGGFGGGGVQSRSADLSANIKKESLIYNDIIKEQLKSINENLGDDIETFIKANQDEVDRMFKDKEGAGWKLLNERITEFFTAKGVAGRESQQVIQDLLNQFLLIPIQLDWSGNEAASTYQPDLELNAANLRKQVNLLEEMKKRYDELSKSAYGYAKSEEKVRQAFKDSFEEIFKGSGIDMKDIDFTSMEGLSASIQKVLDAATNIKEEVKQEIMKKIDSYEARIETDAQVRVRENFAREIEKMFSDYELTIDLQKINLTADAAKDLLGLDYTSLSEVMNKITDWRNQQIAKKSYSEDDMKLYETWMKKVTDKMYAMQKEKAKQYTKYLEHELSERAKLEMQYTTDVAFVKANYQDGSQKDMILANLEKNYSDALNELKWKSFKESSFYVEMMQDLTTMPSDYLNMMMTKLNEWVEKADDLSPKALKEVLKAREKIIEAQVAMSPIRALGESIKGMEDFQKSGKKDAYGQDISNNYKESRRQLEGIILAREEEMDKTRGLLEEQEALLGKLTAQENIQRTINELVGKGYKGVGVTSTLDEIQRAIEDSRSLLNQVEPTQDVGESDAIFQKRLRQFAEEQTEIQGIINLLVELKIQRQEADAMGVDMSTPVSASKEGTLANVRKYKQELDKLEKAQSKDKSTLVYFKQYNKAVHGLAQNISDVTGKVKGVGNAFYNVMEAFGETDEVTKVWKDFGDAMVDSMTNVLNLIPSLITGYTAAGVAINSAMGVIGLIAEGVQMVMTLVSFMARLNDAHADEVIEELQKRIDALEAAYERLERQIQKTWDTMSYMDTYNKQLVNLQQQITAIEAQRAAERSKKNSDEDRIREYGETIDDLREQMEDLRQQQLETFGGIGEEGYRDAAQGFVDAWKSAFLETGDGLQGLKEHFDEFLNDWFVKQATMRIAGKMLDNVFSMIDAAVDESGPGGANVIFSEIQAIKDEFATISPHLSDAAEQLAKVFGIDWGEGELSGLAAGIQGRTEEQANVLEAYLNSVRTYTANIDTNVARIAEILGAGSRDITNPQLQQLELIAHNTKSIQRMFESVVMSGHTKGQSGIRVFVD